MEKIRVAMIGGGIGSLIGSTHRNAMRLSGKYKLVAACFSPTPEKNKQTADNIAENPRLYHDWQEMIMQEAARKDGAQLVLVATPDHLHFDNCYLALKNYMHVICDKPLC